MCLSWQQGPLAPGAAGHFLVPDPLPERLLFAEPLRRRMRVRFGGTWIADSEGVVLLHEIHPVAKRLGIDAEPVADPGDRPTRFSCFRRSSKTICTARSRSSAGCGFLDTMNPNFPRGHSLQGTRGSPLSPAPRTTRHGYLLGDSTTAPPPQA